MVVSIDNGNKQTKTGRGAVFTSGVTVSTTMPGFGSDILHWKDMIYAGVEDVIRELGKEAAEELTFSSIQKQPEQETENEQGQEPEQHQGEDHEKHANHQRTDCFER